MIPLLAHDWFPLILVLIPIIVILGGATEHFKMSHEIRKERKEHTQFEEELLRGDHYEEDTHRL
jgi:preprotein translocase subunit YajC